MKVAYIGDATSIHVQRWANHFSSIGWDVHILTYSPTEKGLEDKVKQHKLFTAGFLENIIEHSIRKKRAHEIQKILDKIKPNLVHAHGLAKNGEYAYLCKFRPYILTLWGIMDFSYVQNYYHFFTKPLSGKRWKLRQNTFKKASAITTLVEHTRKHIISSFDIDSEKIHTFSWGVVTTIFKPGYDEKIIKLKKELKIQNDAHIILSMRNLDSYYNIHNIISAIPKVVVKHPGAVFIFRRAKGSESFEKEMKKKVKEMGIEKYTIFESEFLSWEEIPIWLNMCDISIMIPNTDQGPLSLVESLACGATVIATDIEGNKEWIEDGKNGFLVNPKDVNEIAKKINYCIEHPEFMKKSAEINTKLVLEKGDWDINSKKMEKLYLELIEKYN